MHSEAVVITDACARVAGAIADEFASSGADIGPIAASRDRLAHVESAPIGERVNCPAITIFAPAPRSNPSSSGAPLRSRVWELSNPRMAMSFVRLGTRLKLHAREEMQHPTEMPQTQFITENLRAIDSPALDRNPESHCRRSRLPARTLNSWPRKADVNRSFREPGVRGSRRIRSALAVFLFLSIALVAPQSASGYATFTHLELIDLAWNDSILPLILLKFPTATGAGIDEAHAYAYGGALIQDLGYYPFGKKFFSNLTHYVRSADFVRALLRNAQDADEFAFAIGALSHFVGDSYGHSEGINPATGIMFPDLARQYGPIVTYEEQPTAHIRTEFGFDDAQIALRRYAPHKYRKHVGFRVSRVLLDRAFYETYGLSAADVLGKQRAAIGSYRYAVQHIIPLFAKVTIVNVRSHLPPDPRDTDSSRLEEAIAMTDYARYWGQYHHGPAMEDYILGFLVRLVPKIGILKILAIKAPTTETEALFVKSLNDAVTRFRSLLADLATRRADDLALLNRDLDTGNPVKPGAYELTDQTYAELLARISVRGVSVPSGIRRDILAYYSDPNAPISTKKNAKAWEKVQMELARLRQ